MFRGGRTWETFLNRKLELLNKKLWKLSDDYDFTDSGNCYNLELLTALRRVQKKSDPLTIALDAKGPLETTPLSLPKLKATIKNVDSEKAAVALKDGGDYRSGRQARWRIVGANDKAAELPIRELSGLIIGGGMYQETILKYGEFWETTLDVRSFVRIVLPGTYSFEVLYHDTSAIADPSDISGLIVARSKPHCAGCAAPSN